MSGIVSFIYISYLFSGTNPTESLKLSDEFAKNASVQLFRAACTGDVAAIRSAAKGGAVLNGRDDTGLTPLISALKCRNFDGLLTLLEMGADPDVFSSDGASPAWLASMIPDKRFLGALIKAGVKLDGDPNNRNTSALLGSITIGFQKGYWDNFRLTMDGDINLNIRYGPNPGVSAADKAVGLGLFGIALQLIDRGYDLDLDDLRRIAEKRPVDNDSEEYSRKAALLDRLAKSQEEARR